MARRHRLFEILGRRLGARIFLKIHYSASTAITLGVRVGAREQPALPANSRFCRMRAEGDPSPQTNPQYLQALETPRPRGGVRHTCWLSSEIHGLTAPHGRGYCVFASSV